MVFVEVEKSCMCTHICPIMSVDDMRSCLKIITITKLWYCGSNMKALLWRGSTVAILFWHTFAFCLIIIMMNDNHLVFTIRRWFNHKHVSLDIYMHHHLNIYIKQKESWLERKKKVSRCDHASAYIHLFVLQVL